jgi:inward rectifier potassium channel
MVNRRANSIMELEAKLMLMTVETVNGKLQRNYKMLRLERPTVLFMPLSWTVVHPIDAESPLWGKTAEDMARLQAEVLILVKAYDDTFAQTVLSRHSYRHDEFVWDRRFAPAFFVDEEGDLVLELKKVGDMA